MPSQLHRNDLGEAEAQGDAHHTVNGRVEEDHIAVAFQRNDLVRQLIVQDTLHGRQAGDGSSQSRRHQQYDFRGKARFDQE